MTQPDIRIELTMLGDDQVEMRTVALGFSPAVLVEIEKDGDDVVFDVTAGGMGHSLAGLGQTFQYIADALKNQGDDEDDTDD